MLEMKVYNGDQECGNLGVEANNDNDSKNSPRDADDNSKKGCCSWKICTIILCLLAASLCVFGFVLYKWFPFWDSSGDSHGEVSGPDSVSATIFTWSSLALNKDEAPTAYAWDTLYVEVGGNIAKFANENSVVAFITFDGHNDNRNFAENMFMANTTQDKMNISLIATPMNSTGSFVVPSTCEPGWWRLTLRIYSAEREYIATNVFLVKDAYAEFLPSNFSADPLMKLVNSPELSLHSAFADALAQETGALDAALNAANITRAGYNELLVSLRSSFHGTSASLSTNSAAFNESRAMFFSVVANRAKQEEAALLLLDGDAFRVDNPAASSLSTVSSRSLQTADEVEADWKACKPYGFVRTVRKLVILCGKTAGTIMAFIALLPSPFALIPASLMLLQFVSICEQLVIAKKYITCTYSRVDWSTLQGSSQRLLRESAEHAASDLALSSVILSLTCGANALPLYSTVDQGFSLHPDSALAMQVPQIAAAARAAWDGVNRLLDAVPDTVAEFLRDSSLVNGMSTLFTRPASQKLLIDHSRVAGVSSSLDNVCSASFQGQAVTVVCDCAHSAAYHTAVQATSGDTVKLDLFVDLRASEFSDVVNYKLSATLPLQSSAPTIHPTMNPVTPPTASPTRKPTTAPTTRPSGTPTASPTRKPTTAPTTRPTAPPTPLDNCFTRTGTSFSGRENGVVTLYKPYMYCPSCTAGPYCCGFGDLEGCYTVYAESGEGTNWQERGTYGCYTDGLCTGQDCCYGGYYVWGCSCYMG